MKGVLTRLEGKAIVFSDILYMPDGILQIPRTIVKNDYNTTNNWLSILITKIFVVILHTNKNNMAE